MHAAVFRFLYRGWRARIRDQKAEIKALVSALHQDDLAVDVGANKGCYLPSLACAVPHGRVVAFEPQPRLAEYLDTIVASARLTNIKVEAAGISDRAGSMTLAVPGRGEPSPGASFESAVMRRGACRLIEVPVYTLDDYFAGERRRIGAVKIDVEGHELAVLRGAEHLLRAHKPLVVCECEARHMTHGNVQTTLDYFRSLHYDGWFVHRSRLVPIAEFDPARHQRDTGGYYWHDKDYCNNFVMASRQG